MSIELLFSILGLIGGLLCCKGDILFDFKGKGTGIRLQEPGEVVKVWGKGSCIFGVSILKIGLQEIAIIINERKPIIHKIGLADNRFSRIQMKLDVTWSKNN